MPIRPIDIARKLNISTTALRHYEDWGIVPKVERGTNGYRIYRDIHIAYFECIRAMNPGFGMGKVSQIMKRLIQEDIDGALWIMSEAQAELYQDKVIAEKAIQALESEHLSGTLLKHGKTSMSIGEVSDHTTIPSSSIRHWEKMGLIQIHRNAENGYRSFTAANVRQILIIRTLKSAVWSLDLIKQIIKELDDDNVANAIHTARESLRFLNELNRSQLRGAYYMHCLLERIVTTKS